MKKILILLVILLGVGGAAAGVIAYQSRPEVVMKNAIVGTAEGLLERDEVRPFRKVLTEGSLSFFFSEAMFEDGSPASSGISFEGKLYFGKGAVMAEDVLVKLGEREFAGDAYLSDELLYVSEEKTFMDAVGVRYDSLAAQLKNSIFAPTSGSDFALPEEIYDVILDIAEQTPISNAEEDATKLLESHEKPLLEILTKNILFTSAEEEIFLGGEKKTVRVVSAVLDGEALSYLLVDLYEYFKNDTTVPAFLDKYGSALLPSLKDAGEVDEDAESLGQWYKDLLAEEAEWIEDTCEDLRKDEELELKLSVVTPKLGSKAYRIVFELGADGLTDSRIVLDFGGKAARDARKISLSLDGIEYIYEITVDDAKAYEAALTYKADGFSPESYALKIDKEKKTFAFDYDENEILSGSYGEKTEDGKRTIFLESFEGVTMDLALAYDEEDAMPSAPTQYTTVDQITEEKLKAWISVFD